MPLISAYLEPVLHFLPELKALSISSHNTGFISIKNPARLCLTGLQFFLQLTIIRLQLL